MMLIGISDRMIWLAYVFEEDVHVRPDQVQDAQKEPREGHPREVNGHGDRGQVLQVPDGRQEGQRGPPAQHQAPEVHKKHRQVLDSVENEHETQDREDEAHEEPVEVRVLDEELGVQELGHDAGNGDDAGVSRLP